MRRHAIGVGGRGGCLLCLSLLLLLCFWRVVVVVSCSCAGGGGGELTVFWNGEESFGEVLAVRCRDAQVGFYFVFQFV